MDLEKYRVMFLEDATPILARVKEAMADFQSLDPEALHKLYLDAHTLKGGYLQFGMQEEAKWASSIEQAAHEAFQAKQITKE